MLGTAKADVTPSPTPDWSESWPSLAELGLPAFCVAEQQGGFGLRADAATTSATELGAALHASPYAAITAAAHALASTTHPDALALLTAVLSGERTCGFAVSVDGSTAPIVDGADQLDALVIAMPATCELLAFTDRTGWSVTPDRHGFNTSRPSGAVHFDESVALRLEANATAVATDLFGLLLAADSLGCVQRTLDRTVEYAMQRQTFGKAIGGYQAVQHRLVDHSVRARGMAMLVSESAALLGAGSPDAARHVAMAEVSVSTGATHILHDLVQLTGGIGFTWEYGLHHYQRRVHQNDRLAGNPRAAVRRLSEIEGWANVH